MAAMSKVRRRVLEAVAENDVTRRYNRHLWWVTEDESRPLTAAERKHLYVLRDEDLIVFEPAAGYRNRMIGYYRLTSEGAAVLLAERARQSTHVVEYYDSAWGGWRRADAFGDRPQAEFTVLALARALAVDMLGYVRQVRIRSTAPDGTETITPVRRR